MLEVTLKIIQLQPPAVERLSANTENCLCLVTLSKNENIQEAVTDKYSACSYGHFHNILGSCSGSAAYLSQNKRAVERKHFLEFSILKATSDKYIKSSEELTLLKELKTLGKALLKSTHPGAFAFISVNHKLLSASMQTDSSTDHVSKGRAGCQSWGSWP